MLGRGGMALLAALIWLAVSICLPDTGMAADLGAWSRDWQPLNVTLAASSSLDAQTLGEKPLVSSPNKLQILGITPGPESDQSGGASLKLPHNLELNVSFLYNRESPSLYPKRHGGSLPLFNYSMDYHFLPNFKVGLSGYLYHPLGDSNFTLHRPYGDRVMGLGPGVKYDLGRWSFVVKSQVETGRDRGEDFQNWLRVWYAF